MGSQGHVAFLERAERRSPFLSEVIGIKTTSRVKERLWLLDEALVLVAVFKVACR